MNRCLALLALTLSAAPLLAVEKADDKGKKLLTKLFDPSLATAAEATVRIQADGKDIVLGTVVDKSGLILTKGSELFGKDGKLRENLACLVPALQDGSAYDIEVKGYHRESDLMLLKVDVDRPLTQVTFAEAKSAEPGNWVAVPGPRTPGAETLEAVAVGVVSATSRPLYVPESRIENSNRGYLGITFANPTNESDTGVGNITNESAKKAGMKVGDNIVGLNGLAVKNRDDIFDVMNLTRPGETLEVKVRRKGKDGDEEVILKVTTIPLANMDRGALQNSMGGSLSDRRGGFSRVIQHDTVLLPRQCGGPLVDLDGKVLGINIARAGRVETWALPADVITPALADLKAGKYPFPSKDVKSAEPVKKDEKKKDDKK
jgi:serine protease Do